MENFFKTCLAIAFQIMAVMVVINTDEPSTALGVIILQCLFLFYQIVTKSENDTNDTCK